MASQEQIASAVAGLRDLADFIEANPHLPYGYTLDQRWLVCLASDEDEAGELAQWARAGGKWDKDINDNYAGLVRSFGPIEMHVYVNRAAVCEKHVVGVETVEVPDPNAPKVTVEREIVAWECKPLLGRVS